MKAIEKATAHYNAKQIRTLEIPEWELTVYAKPITIAEKNKIAKKSNGEPAQFVIHTILEKALDDQGNRLFDLGDKVALMDQCDAAILQRISDFLLESADPEEHEKNS